MAKKTIDMVAITPEKANAQNLTCFITFVVAACMCVILMLVACVLPTTVHVTETTCWISMLLEAVSIGLGYLAYWIHRNALK